MPEPQRLVLTQAEWVTLSGPLAQRLQPRWIGTEAERTGQKTPAQMQFVTAPLHGESPEFSTLQNWCGAPPATFRPIDESTLGARQPECLWTVAGERWETDSTKWPEEAQLFKVTWRAARGPASRPRLMGILNATPDSFSDGGRFDDPGSGAAQGIALIEAGADILDIGGESTRPGSAPVSLEEEWRRVAPLIRSLRSPAEQAGVPLSIDTSKAEVARRAIDCGATWVNDVRGGTADPDMLKVVSEGQAIFVAMHCLAPSKTMQAGVRFGDPVQEVAAWLRERIEHCLEAGIPGARLLLDPGLGFGKHLEHNLSLMRRLGELHSLGCPLLVGPSRKSFIDHLDRAEKERLFPSPLRSLDHLDLAQDSSQRVGGTAAAIVASVAQGAAVLRVHDVATMGQAARLAFALQNPNPPLSHEAGLPPKFS